MTSGLARRRRPRSLAARLLQDGRSVDDPDGEERAELARLEEAGLIRVAWSSYFVCTDHRDDADLVHARDRTCRERIQLGVASAEDPTHDEDDLQYVCDGCRRTHWPLRRRRTTYPRARVDLDLGRVGAWVRERVQELAPGASCVRADAVFRLQHRRREVHVVLLDACLDTRFVTHGFAVSNPTVYVVVAHRALRDRLPAGDWFTVLYLHELVERGHAALRQAMDTLPAGDAITSFREPPPPVYGALRAPPPRVVRRVLGAHALLLHEDRALLDGIEVLPPDATGLLPILGFFVERWREDLLAGKAAGDFCAYSPDEVLDDLEERGVGGASSAGTVRRQINRLKNTVMRNYVARTGLPFNVDELVETVPGEGFRLNPRKVTVLPS